MTAVRSEILHTCNTLKQEANDIISFYRLLQGEEPFAGKFISAGKSIKKQITAIRKLTEPLIVDGPAIIKAAEPIRSKISEINASDATKAKVITIWTNHTGRILGELGTMERLLQLPQVPALPPPSKPQEIHRLFEELDLQLLEMLNIIQEKRPTLSVTDAVFAINQIKNELLKIQDTLAAPTEFNISTCRVIIIELAKKIGSLPFQGIHISAFISHLKQLDAQLAQLKPRSVIPPKKSKIVLTKSQLYLLFAKVIGEPVPLSPLYRNNLKNRNFGKEGPQKLISERVTIADRQGASEKSIFEVTPTQPETDSSGYFGIDPLSKFQSILSSLIKQVAALKKEYRLAGSLEELESQLFQIQSYLQLVAVPLSTLSVQISTLMHRIFKLDVRSIKWRRLANLVGTDLHNLNKAVKQRLPKKALSQRQSLLDNELRTGKIQFSIQDIIHPFIQQAKTHLHFLYGFFNTQPNVLVLKKQLDLPAIALLQMQMTDPSQLLPNLRAAIAYISTLSLEGEIAPLVQYHWLVHTEEIMEYLTAAELVVAVFERENEVEDEARTDASHAISGEGIRTPVQTRILQLCPQITNEASEISKYFNAMIEMEIFVPVATEEANQIHTVVAAITPLIGNLSSANIKAIRSMVSKAIERISGTNPPKNYTSRLVWQEHTKKIRSRLEEIDQILARQTLVLPVSNHRSPSPLPLSPPPKPKDSSKTKRKRKLDPPAETATAPSTSSFASPFEGIIQSSLSQIDAFLKPHDFLAAYKAELSLIEGLFNQILATWNYLAITAEGSKVPQLKALSAAIENLMRKVTEAPSRGVRLELHQRRQELAKTIMKNLHQLNRIVKDAIPKQPAAGAPRPFIANVKAHSGTLSAHLSLLGHKYPLAMKHLSFVQAEILLIEKAETDVALPKLQSLIAALSQFQPDESFFPYSLCEWLLAMDQIKENLLFLEEILISSQTQELVVKKARASMEEESNPGSIMTRADFGDVDSLDLDQSALDFLNETS